MSYLDRKDLLSADLMTRSITKEGSIKYYNTDKNVANIYMKLMAASSDGVQKEVAVDEASNYTVKIDVIKPKTNQIRTVPGVLNTDLADETCAIWKFELGEDFTNQIGEVICQTYVKNATQNLTMKYFAYTVEADKLTGLNGEIVTDPDLPILKELIKKVEELQANGGGGSGGTNGREIELQKSSTHIQWRYVGDSAWTNLITIDELKVKGDIGLTPNLQIGSVETLTSGNNATASISGTSTNPLLNLGIPRGADGGGYGEWKLIKNVSVLEADGVSQILISTDTNGNSFSLNEIWLRITSATKPNAYFTVTLNDFKVAEVRGNAPHLVHIYNGGGYWLCDFYSFSSAYAQASASMYGIFHYTKPTILNVPSVNSIKLNDVTQVEMEILGR
ncbi:hypothetical protein TPDSL_22770 [Terrisporobacter petrolearius]|uniref:hypothetical protein n=1 Tax=Terrisporobacter petrolearius TaxID=1460447 RepID=UPI0033687FF1